eukprot:m51a1_g10649 hypothetical protein (198) ;mRNA; r:35680-36338
MPTEPGRSEPEVQLEGAELEAREVARVLGINEDTGLKVRQHATKQSVMQLLAEAELVHIATHSSPSLFFVDEYSPAGATALARTNSCDGWLRATEIQDMKLRGNPLVVLSSCSKATREEEGVLGIARAALFAGARGVVASLWLVDDEAAVEFMRSFYSCLRQGARESEAVSQAASALKRDKRFNPTDWACFVYIGGL